MKYLYNVYNGGLWSIRDIIISVIFFHQLKFLGFREDVYYSLYSDGYSN